MENGILADQHGDVDWVRLLQKGCFQNSPDVERYIDTRCKAGQRRFVVDLQQCGGLDSTFMGMLMAAGKRLLKVSGCLQIINAAGRNAQLLRGLGVHYFCPVAEDAGEFKEEVTAKQEVACEAVPHECLSKAEQKSHCLKAHEALVEGCQDNKSKFTHVIQLMRDEGDTTGTQSGAQS